MRADSNMKRVTHDPALMAATLVCGIFLASAPVVHADFVVLKDGTRVDAEMINYNAGRKEYALTDEIGAVIRKSAKAVIEISVAPPPGLDRAAGMLKDPANFETLVPVLQKVVEEYRGRKWDIEAAGYLVEVYLKQGKTKDAITISEEVFAHSQPRWVPAAYSRQYLHLLVKDGQTAAVRKRVDKMLLSNHAPTMAIACLVRGDVLMTEGGDLDKLGRGHLWKGEIPGCLHQNHIFAVRCFLHKLRPMFLAYVTAAKYGRDYFEATGKKTTNLACTNTTKVGEFPIPLPRLTEQEAICAYLEKKLGEVKSIVTVIETQITTLTAYRKSLIHECVTGQRRITEADIDRVKAHG